MKKRRNRRSTNDVDVSVLHLIHRIRFRPPPMIVTLQRKSATKGEGETIDLTTVIAAVGREREDAKNLRAGNDTESATHSFRHDQTENSYQYSGCVL
mmetsp:Transcript_14820/g.22897  ORF Transcript_14820/g.22897 Transcript_14820/m.22897 type:complete len:97 (+) Transcript_14820:1119-1409(+)